MRTLFINIKLDICKIDDMKVNRTCITGYLSCQIHHLLLCPVTGIRRCMEIDCIDLHTSLCDHVTGYRGINTTR